MRCVVCNDQTQMTDVVIRVASLQDTRQERSILRIIEGDNRLR